MAYTGNVQTVRSSGAMLAANQKPDIDTVLRVIEPYQTPILQYMFFSGKSGKVVRNQAGKFDWFEDELLPHQTTILSAEALSGASPDTIVAEATDIDITMFKLGDLVYIENTDEMLYVSAQTVGTSVTFAHPDGATAPTAWVAADIGKNVKVIGSMFSENAGTPLALSTQEIAVTNRLTIFNESVKSTGRQQAGDSWTDGTTHDEQVAKKMTEMKLQYERNFIYSLSTGVVTASSIQTTYGKGLLGFISTNAVSYSGVLGEPALDAYLLSVGAKGSDQRTHYCGNQQFMDIQKIVKDKTGNFPPVQKSAYGVRFHTYIHGVLDLEIVRHPLLDGKFTDWGITVEKKQLIPRFMANDKKGSRKFRIENGVETPGTDRYETKLLADIGIQFPNEEKAGYLYQT
jgi:hypothetical protein